MIAATQMVGSCVVRVHDHDAHPHTHENNNYSADEDHCPYYENAPYQDTPTSCYNSSVSDCCNWDVEPRWDRECSEYWCYYYSECEWVYQSTQCES